MTRNICWISWVFPGFRHPARGRLRQRIWLNVVMSGLPIARTMTRLLFGAPRLVRFLSINSQEWLPSKGRARQVLPELIDLEYFLGYHGITRPQLIDMGILIGTDFNPGVKGIGPKTALKLIKKHGIIGESLR